MTIESTQAGEWATGATWVGGTKPGTGDDAQLKHKVTITDTTEYCKTCTIGDIGSGGELEINAATADASLVFDDHTDAKFWYTDSAGILDLNGTSPYWAKLIQAGTNRQWDIDLRYGTTTMDRGYIDYVKPKTDAQIDITEATITINNSRFLSANRNHPDAYDRWHFYGVPTSITVDYMSEFENIYWALTNADYDFTFTVDPNRVNWGAPVVGVESSPYGSTISEIQLASVMSNTLTFEGSFNTRDDRFKVSELETMRNTLGTFMFQSPYRIFESVRIMDVQQRLSNAGKYMRVFSVEIKEDD